MSLDKGRILNELNSVMSQLQGADCGCMGKLFSYPNQQQQPMQMGCSNTGGCCNRGPCHQASPAPHCGHVCNPVKMYTDTYDYLNTNLMQPTVKEIMDDFQGMNSSNTVTGLSSAGGNAGGLSDMCMSSGNPSMGGMGAQGTMGMPNMSQGMGAQIMKMMNMSGGDSGKKPPKFSMGAPGNKGMPNANPMVAERRNYMQNDQMAAHHGNTNMYSEQGRTDPMMNKGMAGYNSHVMQQNTNMMQPLGQVPVEGGHPTMRSQNINNVVPAQGNMHNMRASPINRMPPGHGNMRMAQNNMNPVHSGGFNAPDAVTASTMLNPPNMTQHENPMPVHGHVNQINPSQGIMGQGQMSPMNIPQSENILQASPNAPCTNVVQGKQANPHGQGNVNGGAYNPMRKRCCCRGNAAPKGISFNPMFPGAVVGPDGGELGFDPMAIAWQMNPNNQKMAAVQMMNNLMSNNKGFSKYMNNFMGNPQQSANAQANQPPAAGHAAEATLPPVLESNQGPQSGGLNSIAREPNELESHPVSIPGQVADGEKDASAAPVVQEPIYPAEMNCQPPRPPREQDEFNTLGQPIQLFTSDRYNPRHLPHAQALPPQPFPYSTVKSTISKTSIPRRSTVRIPSRARVNLNRGTASATGPSANASAYVGSQSDGRLHAPPRQPSKQVPIEPLSKVAGDATSGQENAVPVKMEESKGSPEGSPVNEAGGGGSGAMSRGKHNGLQDRELTPCPNSSWSFGTPRLPYPHHYVPPPPQRAHRRRY